jgi:cytochrome b involved in lipid metabolism
MLPNRAIKWNFVSKTIRNLSKEAENVNRTLSSVSWSEKVTKMAQRQIDWAEQAEQLPWIGEITKEEVAKHNTPTDCWIILKGDVYNITSYLTMHPSGPECILNFSGDDLTEAFMARHRWVSPNLIAKVKIGTLKV